ncbi:MAG: pyrroline-5-carboxylate reductase [Candidatus Anstonellales archaeon]
MKKVGIIGCGNMGSILVESVVNVVGKNNTYCFDVDKEKSYKIKKVYKVKVLKSNFDLLNFVDVVLIAVKPQQIKDLLVEIRPYIKKEHLFISIAAGVKIKTIEKILEKKVQIVRAMPNLPLKVSCGVTAVCKNKFCNTTNYNFAKEIFRYKGIVLEVKEKLMDAITAISGSGPAYIFYISEILQNVAKDLNLPKRIIPNLVNYTILGAAKMLIQEKMPAFELKNSVTSKGGTTEQALNIFYKHKIEDIFFKAIFSAYKRAEEFSKLVDKA